jgi:predicted PurR-regulated permease PerM
MNEPLTNRAALRTALALALILFGLFLVWRFVAGIASAVLVLLMGLFLAVALSGPVEWLHRHKVPRAVASILILVGILVVLVLLGYLFLPTLADQASQVTSDLPSAFSRLDGWLERVADRTGVPVGLSSLPSSSTISGGRELVGGALGLFGSLASFVFGLVVIFFVPLYLASSPESVLSWTLRLFPPDHRPRVHEVLCKIRSRLLNWIKGRLISMAIVGALSMSALYLIGIPGAIFLGIFSGIIEFVPYFGPIISAIPPMLLGLVGNPVDALWVALAYLAIQQAEGNVITPLVIHEATSLHPVVVVAAVTLAGAAFGVLGSLIAVPTAVVIMVLIEELWFRRVEEAASDYPRDSGGYHPNILRSREP